MAVKMYFRKRAIIAFVFSFFSLQGISQQFLTKIDGWNAYVHLPDDYTDSLSKSYPLILFIPGLGEVGTDPSKLLINGPSKFVAGGHNMKFTVNGRVEKPIVISIQPVTAWPNAYTVNVKIDSIIKRWRVDQTRVNGTGLSMGAWSWNNYVDGYSSVYYNKITSIVSMSAPEPDNTISNMKFYGINGGRWWGFEGNTDLRKGDQIRDTLNKYVAGSARYTLYNGGHCCWNTFYDPTYNENGESIYTWMLKQKKVALAPLPNQRPNAFAGNDTSSSTILSTITLKGAGNDPDGNPIQFAWAKVSGPAATINTSGSAQTSVVSLTSGTYKFELRVTDALGAEGRDTIVVSNGSLLLPVKLMSFQGALVNRKAELTWKTASEANSSSFVIEKSTDGINYNPVGTVAAGGYTTQETEYHFTDPVIITARTFYRLKMVDIDASFMYSNILMITSNGQTEEFEMIRHRYQGSTLSFTINASEAGKMMINVVDSRGRVIHTSAAKLSAGENEISRQIISARGIYYLSVSTGNRRITKSIIHE